MLNWWAAFLVCRHKSIIKKYIIINQKRKPAVVFYQLFKGFQCKNLIGVVDSSVAWWFLTLSSLTLHCPVGLKSLSSTVCSLLNYIHFVSAGSFEMEWEYTCQEELFLGDLLKCVSFVALMKGWWYVDGTSLFHIQGLWPNPNTGSF